MTTPTIRLVGLIPAFMLTASTTLSAGAATPAGASDRAFRFHERATVEVKPIERQITKPEAPPAGTGGPGGRPVSLQDFLLVRDKRRKEITASQIAKMRSLIAITPDDDPQKPDFLFRLGELHAENQRSYSDAARALDQKIFDAPAANKGALRGEQQRLEAQQRASLLESVKAYIGATRYHKYGRMDEVLFRLAYLLTSVKKEEEAREFLLRLLKDHPTSRYVPDAYLAFADLHFDRGDMDGALRFYEKVEQFPASGVYPYAVYKKGWCQVNLGDFKTALETFVGVARMAEDTKVKAPLKQLEVLAKEARKDIVLAYAHVAGPDRAWEFFRRTGGDGAGKMMEALAERYWEQGQAADSTRTYKKIIAENMQSPRICEWQNKVLRNELSAGDKGSQVQELERLGVVYDRGPKQKPERALECENAFHDAAREMALVWHREAQRTRNAETYRLAERAYRLFLSRFPNDPSAYEMSFYNGELLWALARWKDAAEQYTQVVEMNPSGKYLRDAAYAAVLAWKNALAVADDEERQHVERDRKKLVERTMQGKLAPLPIPPNQQKMIAAFRTYRKHVPDAPELPVILYREAYVHYDHNHFAAAEPLFLDVVQRYPEHQLAIFAANLFLDALNAQGKSKEVMVWVRKFLDTPALVKDRSFAEQMISLMSDGYDGEAREHEKRGDAKECGRSFLAAAEALPAHGKHAERLWNAGQCFQNAHLIGKAVSSWNALIKEHPQDVLAKRALYRVGAGYHQLAYYTRAADNYEEFAKQFPGEPQAVTALGNATVFREGLGQSAEALADMDAFVAFYGRRNPNQAAGVFFQKGEIYDRAGKYDELRAHLRSYLDTWGGKGGLDRQVQAHFRLGELAWKGSCARPSEDGACLQIDRLTSTRGQQLISAARRKFGKGKRTQCGPATKSKIVVLDRNRPQASAAEEHFRTAIRLWNGGDASNPIVGRDVESRRAIAAYAAAGAAFYLAEKEYENLLRVRFPQNLDFSRPARADNPRRQAATARKLDDSNKRFATYLAEKGTLLEKARAQYLDVFKLRQAQWTIAAATRVGQLHQDFAGQLYTAPIPDDLLDVDQWGNRPRDLYCDALEDQATKVEVQAIEGFRSCLTAATRQSWYNEWSRTCERELNQLEPVQFPLTSEMKPETGYAPTVISATPVISELGDEAVAGTRR